MCVSLLLTFLASIHAFSLHPQPRQEISTFQARQVLGSLNSEETDRETCIPERRKARAYLASCPKRIGTKPSGERNHGPDRWTYHHAICLLLCCVHRFLAAARPLVWTQLTASSSAAARGTGRKMAFLWICVGAGRDANRSTVRGIPRGPASA